MATLADLTTYLGTQSLGASKLTYGVLEADPDVVVVLMQTPGQPSEPDLGTPNMRMAFPNVVAYTRGVINDYDGPQLMMQKVITAFTKVVNQTLSGTGYKAIEARSEPAFLRRDENFRVLFVCNFKVTKVYSTT